MHYRIKLRRTALLSVLSVLPCVALTSCTKPQHSTPSVEGGGMAEVRGVRIGDIPYKDASPEEQERFIEKQRKQRKQQDKELQDLKRQQFHDQYYKSRYKTGS